MLIINILQLGNSLTPVSSLHSPKLVSSLHSPKLSASNSSAALDGVVLELYKELYRKELMQNALGTTKNSIALLEGVRLLGGLALSSLQLTLAAIVLLPPVANFFHENLQDAVDNKNVSAVIARVLINLMSIKPSQIKREKKESGKPEPDKKGSDKPEPDSTVQAIRAEVDNCLEITEEQLETDSQSKEPGAYDALPSAFSQASDLDKERGWQLVKKMKQVHSSINYSNGAEKQYRLLYDLLRRFKEFLKEDAQKVNSASKSEAPKTTAAMQKVNSASKSEAPKTTAAMQAIRAEVDNCLEITEEQLETDSERREPGAYDALPSAFFDQASDLDKERGLQLVEKVAQAKANFIACPNLESKETSAFQDEHTQLYDLLRRFKEFLKEDAQKVNSASKSEAPKTTAAMQAIRAEVDNCLMISEEKLETDSQGKEVGAYKNLSSAFDQASDLDKERGLKMMKFTQFVSSELNRLGRAHSLYRGLRCSYTRLSTLFHCFKDLVQESTQKVNSVSKSEAPKTKMLPGAIAMQAVRAEVDEYLGVMEASQLEAASQKRPPEAYKDLPSTFDQASDLDKERGLQLRKDKVQAKADLQAKEDFPQGYYCALEHDKYTKRQFVELITLIRRFNKTLRAYLSL